LISEAGITTGGKRLFAEPFKLGMFDPRIQHNSFSGCSIGEAKHSVHILKMAQESIVLLQNNRTLPLTGNTRFSVFRANVDGIDMLWGNYDGFNIQGTKTMLEGLR
jgi:beta-glucosidase